MNAEELLRHFERVADAPEALPRLRQLVLDLAVRGKLLPQQPGDAPQANALAAARSELSERAKATGRLRFTPSAPFAKAEVGDQLPLGWVAARVNDTGLYINGLAFKPSDWKASGLPIIRIQNLSDDSREFNYAQGEFADEVVVRNGDILVSWSATLDAYRWTRETGVLNQHIFRVIQATGLTDSGYLLLLLKRAIRDLSESVHAHGLVMTHINRGPFLNHVVWIPPLAEQRRIVAKVGELMALCDRLEAARAEREAASDRLTAASLARLNTPDPETFSEDARFLLDAFSALTTKPDQVEQLRQTIRNMGVRGRLVPQDPNDESATSLLVRIADAKSKHRHGERRRTSSASSAELSGVMDLDLPPGWVIARWDDIAKKIGDIDHKMPEQVPVGVPYVSPRDFGPGNQINFDGAKRISRADYERLATKIRPEVGDIIFPRYGTIGENRLVDDPREFLASYSCCVIKVLHDYDDPEYQFLFSISDICRTQARAAENKTTQANVGIQSIKEFLVPLPPLAEQRRIVLKVKELMELCDGLESALRESVDYRRRMLEALLQVALQPAEVMEPVS